MARGYPKPLPLLLLLPLLLAPLCIASPTDCPANCICTEQDPTIIDCERRLGQGTVLETVTNHNATTLKLRKNPGLRVIPSGAFDFMEKLERVEFDEGGWDCGCDIDYLRGWLLMQPNRRDYRKVTCSSPPHLSGRIVMYLGPDEVAGDCRRSCDLTVTSQGLAYATLLLHGALVCFLASVVRRVKARNDGHRSGGSDDGGGGGGGYDFADGENPYAPVNDERSHTYDHLQAEQQGKAKLRAGAKQL